MRRTALLSMVALCSVQIAACARPNPEYIGNNECDPPCRTGERCVGTRCIKDTIGMDGSMDKDVREPPDMPPGRDIRRDVTPRDVGMDVQGGIDPLPPPDDVPNPDDMPIGVDSPIMQICNPGDHLCYDDITEDRKSTRLNSSHLGISYAVFCLK